mmetsp:Transcript_119520/g.338252  ORF Transcript_119520/g.338252 Transcript_119520/m.338252 type:complete len:153 (-) Transcript_119520:199-657(-)
MAHHFEADFRMRWSTSTSSAGRNVQCAQAKALAHRVVYPPRGAPVDAHRVWGRSALGADGPGHYSRPAAYSPPVVDAVAPGVPRRSSVGFGDVLGIAQPIASGTMHLLSSQALFTCEVGLASISKWTTPCICTAGAASNAATQGPTVDAPSC